VLLLPPVVDLHNEVHFNSMHVLLNWCTSLWFEDNYNLYKLVIWCAVPGIESSNLSHSPQQLPVWQYLNRLSLRKMHTVTSLQVLEWFSCISVTVYISANNQELEWSAKGFKLNWGRRPV
jgi:hypothetical protein